MASTEDTTPNPDDDEPVGGDPATLMGELLTAEPGELTDGEITDGVLALARLADQVDAALAGFTSVLDTRCLHTSDGARSPAAWLAARTDVTRQDAAAIAHRGRDLRSCPHVDAAYRAGLLGTAKVRLLLAARRKVEAIFAQHEAELVEHLRPLTVAHASVVLARWRAHALATAGIDDDPAPTDPTQNSLHLSRTLGGRYALDGDADVETGALLDAAVTAEVDALFRTGAFTRHDTLAAGQRRMTALANLVNRGAATTPAPAPAPEAGTDAPPDTAGNGTPPGTTAEGTETPTPADPGPIGTEPHPPGPASAGPVPIGAEPVPAGSAPAGTDAIGADPATTGIDPSGTDATGPAPAGTDTTGDQPLGIEVNRLRPSGGHVANAAWFADAAATNGNGTTNNNNGTRVRSSGRGPVCRCR